MANKGALTCLKLCCSLTLLMYFYTGCSDSRGGVAVDLSTAESAPRANEAGGESRLWADAL